MYKFAYTASAVCTASGGAAHVVNLMSRSENGTHSENALRFLAVRTSLKPRWWAISGQEIAHQEKTQWSASSNSLVRARHYSQLPFGCLRAGAFGCLLSYHARCFFTSHLPLNVVPILRTASRNVAGSRWITASGNSISCGGKSAGYPGSSRPASSASPSASPASRHRRIPARTEARST